MSPEPEGLGLPRTEDSQALPPPGLTEIGHDARLRAPRRPRLQQLLLVWHRGFPRRFHNLPRGLHPPFLSPPGEAPARAGAPRLPPRAHAGWDFSARPEVQQPQQEGRTKPRKRRRPPPPATRHMAPGTRPNPTPPVLKPLLVRGNVSWAFCSSGCRNPRGYIPRNHRSLDARWTPRITVQWF